MKTNAQKEMDNLIENLDTVPTLLIHACCAPCSSYVIEYLSNYFHINILYYNPNITNPEEYNYRLSEEERLINEMPVKYPVKLIKGEYNPDCYLDAVKGFGADYFLTTLTISPLKNAENINEIGEKIASEYGVKYLPSDFKKKNGYKRSIELSREYDLYRQNYCGCVFSRK